MIGVNKTFPNFVVSIMLMKVLFIVRHLLQRKMADRLVCLMPHDEENLLALPDV